MCKKVIINLPQTKQQKDKNNKFILYKRKTKRNVKNIRNKINRYEYAKIFQPKHILIYNFDMSISLLLI